MLSDVKNFLKERNSSIYIKIPDLIIGGFYYLHARNFSYGVYDGKNVFIGIRTKFVRVFLDTELHWDSDENYGTVKPFKLLKSIPSETYPIETNNLVLFNWIKERIKDL